MTGTRLPGMEDAQIEKIDTLARQYKKLQRQRMATLAKEVELKDKLLAEMRGLKKTKYKYDDVDIEIVPTGEKLKVRIAAEEEEGDDPDPLASDRPEASDSGE